MHIRRHAAIVAAPLALIASLPAVAARAQARVRGEPPAKS